MKKFHYSDEELSHLRKYQKKLKLTEDEKRSFIEKWRDYEKVNIESKFYYQNNILDKKIEIDFPKELRKVLIDFFSQLDKESKFGKHSAKIDAHDMIKDRYGGSDFIQTKSFQLFQELNKDLEKKEYWQNMLTKLVSKRYDIFEAEFDINFIYENIKYFVDTDHDYYERYYNPNEITGISFSIKN